MLPQTLFLAATALSVVAAGPVKKRCPSQGASPISSAPAASATSSTPTAPSASASSSVSAAASPSASAPPAVGPSLPSTGAGTQLPAASGQLQHIVVGHGIQNYTCSASGVATAAGALAVLYDITDMAPTGSAASSSAASRSLLARAPMSESDWSHFSDAVLRDTDLPLNIVGNAMTPYAADAAAPFRAADADLEMKSGSGMQLPGPCKAIGRHYFDASGTPTFDLGGGQQMLVAKKLNDTAAPAGADRGLMDTGAVAWLRLGDNGLGGSHGGLATVYRVYTAGGAPMACTAEMNGNGATMSVPYAAQYWFYS